MRLPEPKQTAFTLVETLVTIVIMAILFSMGLINWNRTIKKQKVINAREQIESALSQGFSNSRAQNKNTTIIGIPNAQSIGIKTCHTSNNNDCETETLNLESSVSVTNHFTITYQAPFGDIDTSSNPNSIIINFRNNQFKSSLNINTTSGLISVEPVTPQAS